MKKMVSTAFCYAVAAMAGGVFYREFTKFNGFAGTTALGLLHAHLFMLGMVFFLLAALFCGRWQLPRSRKFRAFYGLYNAGVPLTAAMLLARGVLQVIKAPLTPALDGAVSGLAGLGHLLTGAGIVLFFLALREQMSMEDDTNEKSAHHGAQEVRG